MKTLIKGGHIIDPYNKFDLVGDLLIDGDKISKISPCIEGSYDICIDAAGLIISPGFIDMHVHLRDPGFLNKEDILSGSEAAAAGGITTLLAMANTNPVCDNVNTLKYIFKKAKQAKVKILPIASVTKNMRGEELCDFSELSNAGAVAFSDDGVPVSNPDLLLGALRQTDMLGKIILSHCEDFEISCGGIINEGIISKKLNVKGMSSLSENSAIDAELKLASQTGARLHICHVSTRQAVESIRKAKKKGIRVTCEATPHHFSLTENELVKMDADYRMSPPLRTKEDVEAIVSGIVDGTIDVISTDHAPHTKEEKSKFLFAPNGVVGLETSLAAGITFLVQTCKLELKDLIYKMSSRPAEILGLKSGNLSVGSTADIVIFSAKEQWRVDVEKFRGKSKNSAFKNMLLTGKVKYTIVNGKLVFKEEV